MSEIVKIAHVHLESPLIISSLRMQTLIIENTKEFYDMIVDLSSQSEGAEGLFVFSSNNSEVRFDKIGWLVRDVFNVDLNDKKILNLLYKRLEKRAIESDMLEGLNKINKHVFDYLDNLFFDLSFALSYNELSPTDIIKSSLIKFEKTYETLEEKIVCYINALIELKNVKFFVFVNLKSILSDVQIQKVFNHCAQEKVGLFLIENNNLRKIQEFETATIITEDLCEIVVNSQDLC